MSKLFQSIRKLATYSAALVVISVIASVSQGSNVQAAITDNSRLNYGNAGAFCNIGDSVRGMVWISNQGDYYGESVEIGEGATSVNVSIRGAANVCGPTPYNGPRNIYAVNVSSTNSSVLWLSGTEFWRGIFPTGAAYQWTNPGGYLNGSLNVAGIAPCSNSGGSGRSIGYVSVGVWRQLRVQNPSNGTVADYGSGVENFNIRVERTCPAFNYNLSPSISVSPQVAEPGANAVLDASVGRTGSTASQPTEWQINTFTRTPAQSGLETAADNGLSPNAYYSGSTQLARGDNVTFSASSTPLPVDNQAIPDIPVGSRICYTLSVRPFQFGNGNWRHTAPVCIMIAKKPKVQVLGGDLIVGRGSVNNPARVSNIVTSSSNKSGTFYGSWTEYAAVPTGCVTGMASGSGYAGGSSTSALSGLSLLTFTQPGDGCAFGGYTQTTFSPNVTARFPISVPAASATPARPANPAVLPSNDITLSSLSGSYQARPGDTALTVRGGTDIPAGRFVVVNAPNATVTIVGNIKYTTAILRNLSDIPQVVIIARNIIIADEVTNIDSWLVAVGSGEDGRINTCGAGSGITETSNLTIRQCANTLTVNGPVMANSLIMRRTAGAGVEEASGDPAEVFNLRADAYLWATNYNASSGRLSTVSTSELPPRF